ncbi:hypothetical protein LJ739_12605 [Aestuariibacter halophilus]|uniref:Uncharacterized protein n=1 Tax=Fluctibacter halophilus TaxID=226011 RepID=A0ABS8GBB3_9ALTE|nr:hypothetical protein [Aestuariibacter halophilus]MCC2617085.1 hypothetical protein [Aestuariibacter halophilus]
MLLCLLPALVRADNFAVDRVYHPYVLPYEREVEWRFTSRQNDDGNILTQRFAFGHWVSEYVTVETYIVAARDNSDDFGLEGAEVEVRWMLTEQGKYWADLGVLFEVEKQHDKDIWEFTTGLLIEKEFGPTSLTTNLMVKYEWGQDIDNEIESELRLQYRYRWQPWLQPAVELYAGEDYVGIGPAFMGVHRYEGQKQLKWEVGFIAGLNGDSKDHSLRFALEYEF